MHDLKLVEILGERKEIIEIINYVEDKREKLIERNANISVRLLQAQK